MPNYARLKNNMSVKSKNKILSIHYYLVSAVSLLLFLCVSYGYLLSATVVHVVMQKEIERERSHLHSQISELESEYINRQHNMSEEIASLQGFVSAEEKIFIDKSDVSLVLVTNSE